MNLLNNKESLRSLLRQSDILNTIQGGSVLTRSETSFTEDCMIIQVYAPSVNSNAYNVVLNNNELIVFSILTVDTKGSTPEELMAVPFFLSRFNVPAKVDTDKIEALIENHTLRIILPFHPKQKNTLRQIKVKQI